MMNPLRQFLQARYRRRLWNEFLTIADVGEDVHLDDTLGFISYEQCRKCIKIGNHVWLHGSLAIGPGGHIKVGDHCSFRAETRIFSLYDINIGNNVFGAEGVFISDNNNHPTSARDRKEMTLQPPRSILWKWDRERISGAPIFIEDCVWLGRNSMILKGVTVGRGSIVAAGAVVTKSVPPFSIVAGNPAKVVKTIDNDLD